MVLCLVAATRRQALARRAWSCALALAAGHWALAWVLGAARLGAGPLAARLEAGALDAGCGGAVRKLRSYGWNLGNGIIDDLA
jgi:hypothetical protein